MAPGQPRVERQLMEMLEPIGTTGAGSIQTCPEHLMVATPAPTAAPGGCPAGGDGARGCVGGCFAGAQAAAWQTPCWGSAGAPWPPATGINPPDLQHPVTHPLRVQTARFTYFSFLL